MSIVDVVELTKVYDGRKAVDGISFSIKEGEAFGLLGPNGAGKTTTVSMLSCLISPTSGEAVIAGESITKNSFTVKKRIGLVPQEIALYPSLTARENLIFWGSMYDLSGRDLKNRVEEVMDIVGLKERGDERIDRYSGGMKRRINIAVGLLPRPSLLILDEPTVGVDPQSRRHILDTLKELNRNGLTLLYTSHYMEEVEFLCDRVAIMDLGKIIALGAQKELRLMVGEKDSVKISTVEVVEEVIAMGLKNLEGVEEVRVSDKTVEVLSTKGRKTLPLIINALSEAGIKINSIEVKEPDLESLFLILTGKELRD